MTAADIAAYFGAAAWLPQIGAWIYSAISRPVLNVVSARKIEIGFTTLGPVANATLAISTERRDALVEKITLDVTHDHGEQRHLVWRFLNENQQQVRDPHGNISSQFKNNPAVALKVSTLSLTEKTVGFQDPAFEEMESTTSPRILAHFRHNEAQNGKAAALDQLLQSMEFQQVQHAFDDFMYWRAGSWEFLFSVQIAGVKNPHKQRFMVVLTDDDITTLRKNCELLAPYVRATLSNNLSEPRLITWNWVYPVISAVSD